MRSLRHPDILEFIDGGETDSAVTSSPNNFQSFGKTGPTQDDQADEVEWKIWGLSRISALKFLNGPGTSTHGNLKLTSIFISDLALEVVPEAARYASPELMKTGYEVLKELDPACLTHQYI
ncbi:hypothetical protein H4Q26_002910 [Puccinia striiformis f. sp. tritici PST-130]|nr:hypothetical protein H4Q26_002910 [Puccinia striiformis f. sp. tritici PST-130]